MLGGGGGVVWPLWSVAHETGFVVVWFSTQPCGWVASKKPCGLVVLIKGKKRWREIRIFFKRGIHEVFTITRRQHSKVTSNSKVTCNTNGARQMTLATTGMSAIAKMLFSQARFWEYNRKLADSWNCTCLQLDSSTVSLIFCQNVSVDLDRQQAVIN